MIPEFVSLRQQQGKGFDLYFAGGYSKVCDKYLQENECNRLQSQLNDRSNIKRWIDADSQGKLFIDSGAFSAHTIGATIDVEDYIQYINSISEYISIFAQVDSIPGVFNRPKTYEELKNAPYKSWNNYVYMRDRVLDRDKLLPIFHQGEDFKHLITMLTYQDNSIPYIGISPANDVSVSKKIPFLNKCFALISKYSPDVKTHAFGMTSLKLLEQYPFYSADSTSWLMTAANGGIMTPYGIICVSDKCNTVGKAVDTLPVIYRERLEEYLSTVGLTLQQVSTDYSLRGIANIKYLKNWADNYCFRGGDTGRYMLF